MVQASEVKVLSMGYEVTYKCFFQEQMKALHQATVYASTYKPNVIMFHHVSPAAAQPPNSAVVPPPPV